MGLNGLNLVGFVCYGKALIMDLAILQMRAKQQQQPPMEVPAAAKAGYREGRCI